jgi:hypothetical protein
MVGRGADIVWLRPFWSALRVPARTRNVLKAASPSARAQESDEGAN